MDESKVPRIAQIQYAECKQCKMSYSIYKGMIWPIPFMNPEEEKMIEDG